MICGHNRKLMDLDINRESIAIMGVSLRIAKSFKV